MFTLVLGGARSGKSRFAQSLCANAASVAYLATAQPTDDEMRARIARHREARPAEWLTVEEPLAIFQTLLRVGPDYDLILIDCLTVWLSNFCWHHRALDAKTLECRMIEAIDSILTASAGCCVVAVSNEVGCGIVPETPLGRMFRDLQGIANQRLAAGADSVFQVVAGIPIQIKPNRGVAL